MAKSKRPTDSFTEKPITTMQFYIGTYTHGTSRGIYRAELNSESGEVAQMELVAELDNPTFLALHPALPLLLACSEVRRDGKREGAKLVAYRRQRDGSLIELGRQSTEGSGPCYVTTDQAARVALVAHYASGSVVSLPIAADGTLGSVSQLNQHAGKGPREDRQDGPHAHCIVADPTNRFACAVDLGIDQVVVYSLNPAMGSLAATPTSVYRAREGSGPRHLTFHPDGQYAFLIHELGNTLSVLNWDAEQGTFTELQSVSTLPADYVGESITAEVIVHPNGRFVYGSNRGHDSLVVFAFEKATARLSAVQHISCGGKTPRNFRIDPSGRWLVAANQDSDCLQVFRIDVTSGRLTPAGPTVAIGNPSCIKF